MVPTLLYLLFKKLRRQDWGKIKRGFISRMFIRRNQIIISLVIILILISFALSGQKQARNYKVVRKGNEIGWVTLEKNSDSNATTISMGSEVKVTFLFSFTSVAKEMAEFRDGKLSHSYFYRKRNGDVKADRHTRLSGKNYIVENKSEKTSLNIAPVTYSTLCMYFEEPVGRKQVYSDNYQCFLDIEKKSDGAYRVTGSDGNSTSFYYSNGVCYKVKLDYNLYSATMMLK